MANSKTRKKREHKKIAKEKLRLKKRKEVKRKKDLIKYSLGFDEK